MSEEVSNPETIPEPCPMIPNRMKNLGNNLNQYFLKDQQKKTEVNGFLNLCLLFYCYFFLDSITPALLP